MRASPDMEQAVKVVPSFSGLWLMGSLCWMGGDDEDDEDEPPGFPWRGFLGKVQF